MRGMKEKNIAPISLYSLKKPKDKNQFIKGEAERKVLQGR
jgi:hypothetical protein